MITFTLAGLTPSLNQQLHFAQRKRLQQAWAWEIVTTLVGARPAEPWQRARVTVYRHSTREPDQDNIYGGVKPLIDLLKTMHPKRNPMGLGFIQDDSPRHLDLIVRHVKAPGRSWQKTVVTIEPWINPVEVVDTSAPMRVAGGVA